MSLVPADKNIFAKMREKSTRRETAKFHARQNRSCKDPAERRYRREASKTTLSAL